MFGYCTISDVDKILNQALTSASPRTSSKIPLNDIGGVRDINRIPNSVVEEYISFADNQIDGILSEMYYCPLRPCANGQWTLESDINEYNPYVEMSYGNNLVPGDVILIIDDNSGLQERHTVDQIIDEDTISTAYPVLTFFEASDDVRIVREQLPPPINQIAARYAASFIFDKYFAAEVAPNTSEYGKEMRGVAMGQINDILNGKTVLKCQRRKGDLLGNSWLEDTYQHKDRGYNTSERNMSTLGT